MNWITSATNDIEAGDQKSGVLFEDIKKDELGKYVEEPPDKPIATESEEAKKKKKFDPREHGTVRPGIGREEAELAAKKIIDWARKTGKMDSEAENFLFDYVYKVLRQYVHVPDAVAHKLGRESNDALINDSITHYIRREILKFNPEKGRIDKWAVALFKQWLFYEFRRLTQKFLGKDVSTHSEVDWRQRVDRDKSGEPIVDSNTGLVKQLGTTMTKGLSLTWRGFVEVDPITDLPVLTSDDLVVMKPVTVDEYVKDHTTGEIQLDKTTGLPLFKSKQESPTPTLKVEDVVKLEAFPYNIKFNEDGTVVTDNRDYLVYADESKTPDTPIEDVFVINDELYRVVRDHGKVVYLSAGTEHQSLTGFPMTRQIPADIPVGKEGEEVPLVELFESPEETEKSSETKTEEALSTEEKLAQIEEDIREKIGDKAAILFNILIFDPESPLTHVPYLEGGGTVMERIERPLPSGKKETESDRAHRRFILEYLSNKGLTLDEAKTAAKALINFFASEEFITKYKISDRVVKQIKKFLGLIPEVKPVEEEEETESSDESEGLVIPEDVLRSEESTLPDELERKYIRDLEKAKTDEEKKNVLEERKIKIQEQKQAKDAMRARFMQIPKQDIIEAIHIEEEMKDVKDFLSSDYDAFVDSVVKKIRGYGATILEIWNDMILEEGLDITKGDAATKAKKLLNDAIEEFYAEHLQIDTEKFIKETEFDIEKQQAKRLQVSEKPEIEEDFGTETGTD